MDEAVKVLNVAMTKFNLDLSLEHALIGGAAYDVHGVHFPDSTRELCARSAAILYGSVGGPVHEQHLPKWANSEKNAVLGMRKVWNGVFPSHSLLVRTQCHLTVGTQTYLCVCRCMCVNA